jgi:hypothetical protein
LKSIIIISIFFGICQFSLGQTGIIEGKVYDTEEGQSLEFANVWLDSSKIGTTTDSNGQFKIDSIPFGVYNLRVSYIGYPDTTIHGLNVLKDKPIKINVTLSNSCPYTYRDTSRICGICNKSDKVIPIVYGIPIGKLDHENYYYAGCEITYCNPDWYCKRDKNKFGRKKRN